MARDNTVALSDSEKDKLDAAREKIFNTDEVPYGVVISKLCDDA
jgi:hypothetical protein